MSANIQEHNRPRNVAYDAVYAPYFSSTKQSEGVSLILQDSDSMFAGGLQSDIFLLCLAYAKYMNLKPKELKKREPNIITDAFKESGNWLILSTAIADGGYLSCLENEAKIYKDAEMYANAGFEALLEIMKAHGDLGFAQFIEGEIRDIANAFIQDENKETKQDK